MLHVESAREPRNGDALHYPFVLSDCNFLSEITAGVLVTRCFRQGTASRIVCPDRGGNIGKPGTSVGRVAS
ncbi:MAG: hypothetical protein N2C14_09770 [Planctomycetales bacterium]